MLKVEKAKSFSLYKDKEFKNIFLIWRNKNDDMVNAKALSSKDFEINDGIQEFKNEKTKKNEYIISLKIKVKDSAPPYLAQITMPKRAQAEQLSEDIKSIVSQINDPENKKQYKYSVKKHYDSRKAFKFSIPCGIIGGVFAVFITSPWEERVSRADNRIERTICQTTNLVVKRTYPGNSFGECTVEGPSSGSGDRIVHYALEDNGTVLYYTARVFYNSQNNSVRVENLEIHSNLREYLSN